MTYKITQTYYDVLMKELTEDGKKPTHEKILDYIKVTSGIKGELTQLIVE